MGDYRKKMFFRNGPLPGIFPIHRPGSERVFHSSAWYKKLSHYEKVHFVPAHYVALVQNAPHYVALVVKIPITKGAFCIPPYVTLVQIS